MVLQTESWQFCIVLFLGTITSLATFKCAAQTHSDSRDEHALSASTQQLRYKSATETVTIQNNFSQPMRIKSLIFKVQTFEPDKRPLLIYQVAPLFDLLVVTVTNIGWGPFSGNATLRVFPSDAQTENGEVKISTLFDASATEAEFTRIDELTTLLFPVGSRHVPFSYLAGSTIDFDELKRPPVLPGINQTSDDTTFTVVKPVFETRKVEGINYVYSGAVDFHGELVRNVTPKRAEKQKESATYYGQQLQPLSLSPNEVLLQRSLLSGQLEGGMLNYWYFLFGATVGKMVPEQRVSTRVGITVDLGDGSAKSIVYPVNMSIAPNDELTTAVEYVTSNSASFSTAISAEYAFGESPTRLQDVTRKDRNFKTHVPNYPEIDDDYTKKFIAIVQQKDGALGKRVSEYLDRVVVMSLDERLRAASDPQSSWKFADAVMIGMISQDIDLRTKARNAIQSLIPVLPKVDWFLNERLFALVCRMFPSEATQYAVAEYVREGGSSFPISMCLCLDNCRPYIRGQRSVLLPKLNSTPNQEWLTEDLIIASVVDHPACGDELLSRIKNGVLEYDTYVVWIATEIGNDRVTKAIRDLLESKELGNREAKNLIDALRVCGNMRFSEEVVEYLERVKRSPRYTDSISAALAYLERYPSSRAKPVLVELCSYASNSSVRTSARASWGF